MSCIFQEAEEPNVINEESIQVVAAAHFSKQFVKPLYDSFCFSRIPNAISALLTGKKKDLGLPGSCFPSSDSYDTALLFFLDGFAWRFFERHMSHPFCRRFLENGMVSKLTAQFPSTTAAQVTTIHTGLEVGETGIYEWFQYEPKVDKIIAPLLFSYAGDKVAEALLTSGVPVAEFFPFETTYHKMHEEGITSYLFQHAGISSSAYSQRMGRGSHLTSYFTLKQGLADIKELLTSRSKDQKTYALFYFADIDSVGHRKGLDAKELEDEILSTLDFLEEFMVGASCLNKDKKVAIMVTADHGMAPVDPKKTLYLNKEWPEMASFLKKNKKGELLTPAGSCRDCFLHIKEDLLNEAFTYLTKALEGKAEVWKVEDLISKGLFGSHVSPRFLERVGNLAILPYGGEAIWWYEKHRFEQHFYGAHGGLTREELEIPFLFLAL